MAPSLPARALDGDPIEIVVGVVLQSAQAA